MSLRRKPTFFMHNTKGRQMGRPFVFFKAYKTVKGESVDITAREG